MEPEQILLMKIILCPLGNAFSLIEDGDKLILIDNGIGDKQDDKFLKHYYLHGDVNLHSSLANAWFFC